MDEMRQRNRSPSPTTAGADEAQMMLKEGVVVDRSGEYDGNKSTKSKLKMVLPLLLIVGIVATAAVFLRQTGEREVTQTMDHPPVRNIHPRKPPGYHGPVSEEDYVQKALNETRNRFGLHVHLDKELYRPGDVVYVRGIPLNVVDQTPIVLAEDLYVFDHLNMELKTPSGTKTPVGGGLQIENRGKDRVSFTAQFNLDRNLKGGDYELLVSGGRISHTCIITPGSRKFEVRGTGSRTNAKLAMSMRFGRNGYAPGDQVVVELENVKRLATGSPTVGAKVKVEAQIDGKMVYMNEQDFQVDENGDSTISFTLPASLIADEGVVTLTVVDGANVQSISKTLPLALKSLDVNIYPESGELVPGLKNRVYVEVFSPLTGEPADITGDIQNNKGEILASIATTHEGRGVSTRFHVDPKKKYKLVIHSPKSLLKKEYPLKVSGNEFGAVIHAKANVFRSDDPIEIDVFSSRTSADLRVSVFKLEKLLATKLIQKGKTSTSVKLNVPDESSGDGILRVTVFDEKTGIPIAERLVFRTPSARTNIQLLEKGQVQGKLHASPGEHVEFVVETDRPSFVSVRVTDLARNNLVEPRRRSPSLESSALLEPYVDSLYDADVYLRDEAKIDLLLGTQGWRRFAYNNVTKTLLANKGDSMKNKFLRLFGLNDMKEDAPPILMMARGGGPMMKAAIPHAMPQAAEMAPMAVVADNAAEIDEAEFAEDDDGGIVEMPPPQEGDDMVDDELVDAQFAPRKYAPPPRVERVFAYKSKSSKSMRTDFTETLYFNPGNRTDSKNKVKVTFDLSDSITTFGIFVDTFDEHGVLASEMFELVSTKPIETDVKLPVNIYVGDEIYAPVTVSRTHDGIKSAHLSFGVLPGNGDLTFQVPQNLVSVTSSITMSQQQKTHSSQQQVQSMDVKLDSTSGTRIYVPVSGLLATSTGTEESGSTLPKFYVSSKEEGPNLRGAEFERDALVREATVHLQGFPIEENFGGILKKGMSNTWNVVLPKDTVFGSTKVSIRAYPSPIDQLIDAVEALIREPCGCFEQVSSTTFPMVLALRYLVSLPNPDARVMKLIAKAREMLRKGYEKLISYETSSKGFEWFGNAPGHEALTAYGLYQFQEMSRTELGLDGMVDLEMMGRTQEWLLSRRDGKGGFLRNEKALDSFGYAPPSTTDAYILWSLAKTKLISWSSLEMEVTKLTKEAEETPKDLYISSLTACVLSGYGKKQDLRAALLKRLVSAQNSTSGCIDGSGYETITRTRGHSKMIEATALSVLAWLSSPEKREVEQNMFNIQGSIRCINENAKFGAYGSTQANALSLQAILEYNTMMNANRPSGKFTIQIDDQPETTLKFQATGSNQVLEMNTKFEQLVSGDWASSSKSFSIKVSLETEEEEAKFMLPFLVDASYKAETPNSHPNCSVSLETTLAKTKIMEEGTTTISCKISNKLNEKIPMTVVKVGIPSGAEPRVEKLRELRQRGDITHFETDPTFVILYFMEMAPKEVKTIPIEVTGVIPGLYRAPASAAYIYYENEKKTWVGGTKLEIVPTFPNNLLTTIHS